MTPDTKDFMYLGFTVIFLPMTAFLISIVYRYKKYRADIKYLETNE